MIYVSSSFYTTPFPTEVSGGTTQGDVDWYSLYSVGGSLEDAYGNTEYLNGSFSAGRPRIGWHNLVIPKTLSADFERVETPAASLGNVSTAEVWRTAVGEEETEQTIYFATEEFGACDYIGIAGHNFGSLGVSVTLQTRSGSDNFQDVDIGSDKTGTDVAIPAIDGNFQFMISLDGAAFQLVSVAYSSATNVTFAALVDDINAELTGASVSLVGGNLRFQSDVAAPAGSVLINSVSGVNCFADYVNGYVSINAATGWADVFAAVTPANDRSLLYQFSPQSGVSWRLLLQPQAGTTVAMQMAVVYVGRLLVMPRSIYVGHTPISYGRVTDKISNVSENGKYLGQVISSSKLQTKFEFNNIGPIFYRTHVDLWVQYARSKPFFWAWKPDKYPDEVGYSWLTGDVQPSNQSSANGYMGFGGTLQSTAP